MSRFSLPLEEGRYLLYGNDPPFNTVYAALYASGWKMGVGAAPIKACGYHPAEIGAAGDSQACEYGPYPIDADQLDSILVGWGIDPPRRAEVQSNLVKP